MATTTFIYLIYWQSHYDSDVHVIDTNDDATMGEIYVTYVDDEHVDNHDYDDTTDDDHDNNNGLAWSGPVRPKFDLKTPPNRSYD